MIDTDVASGRGAVHTPGLKDPHPIQGGPQKCILFAFKQQNTCALTVH